VGVALFLLLVCIVAVIAATGGGAIITMIQNPAAITEEAAAGALGGMLALICLVLCLQLVFVIMTGAAYGFFHKQAKGSVGFDKGAIGGGAAAGALSVIGWVLGLCANIVMFAAGPSLAEQLDIPYSAGAGDIVTTLIGSVINLVISLVFSGVLGAIGGVIYAAIAGKPSGAQPAV
jgi:hypothetical protein